MVPSTINTLDRIIPTNQIPLDTYPERYLRVPCEGVLIPPVGLSGPVCRFHV